MYYNLFGVTHDFKTSSLSLENPETNMYIKFKDEFIKTKLLLLPLTLGNVFEYFFFLYSVFICFLKPEYRLLRCYQFQGKYFHIQKFFIYRQT